MMMFSLQKRGLSLFIITTLLPMVAVAETMSERDLPLEAQAAINQGVSAAKQEQWAAAIESFQRARKTAPQAPEVFFNLGLAESKIPGHELRSICWLEAYLLVAPDASNASAVKDQISKLNIKSHGYLKKVLQAVQDAAGQQSGYTRDFNLSQVAGMWTEAGEKNTGLQILPQLIDERTKRLALEEILQAELKLGDIAGAEKTADMLEEPYKSGAIYKIASAQIELQIKLRDFTGALKTINRLQNGAEHLIMRVAVAQAESSDIAGAKNIVDGLKDGVCRGRGQAAIAQVQEKAGDNVGAQKTLAAALQSASDTQDIDGLITIAEVQSAADDHVGAQKTLAAALESTQRTQNEKVRNERLIVIAKAQARGGDITGALNTVGLVPLAVRDEAQEGVIEAQAKSGDTARALQSVALIKDTRVKAKGLIAIAKAQAKAGDIAGPQKILDQLEAQHSSYEDDARIIIADALVRNGDVNEALDIARSSSHNKFDIYSNIMIAQAGAGDIAGAKNTARRLNQRGWKEEPAINAILLAKEGAIDDALKTASKLIYHSKARTLLAIAQTQARNGDIEGAINTANSIEMIRQETYRSEAKYWIAVIQAKAGDIAGATRTTDLIDEEDDKALAKKAIAKVQAEMRSENAPTHTINVTAKSHAPARQPTSHPSNATYTLFDWISKLDETDESDPCPLNSRLFLDLSGYLTDLPSRADYSDTLLSAFFDTAKKLITAQNIIDQMLENQADKQ